MKKNLLVIFIENNNKDKHYWIFNSEGVFYRYESSTKDNCYLYSYAKKCDKKYCDKIMCCHDKYSRIVEIPVKEKDNYNIKDVIVRYQGKPYSIEEKRYYIYHLEDRKDKIIKEKYLDWVIYYVIKN